MPGNPNDPNYPLDGRKGAQAAKQVIATLIRSGISDPTGTDILAVVAAHPATDAAIVYRQAMRQRLHSATALYFRMFAPPDGCRLVGADYRSDGFAFDLVWQTPSEAVVVEELMTERRQEPTTASGTARINGVVQASRQVFGARLRGGRVCVFGKPGLSFSWDTGGTESAFDALDLS